jgi:uncharacterized protein (UPF0305 family)
MPKPNLSQVFTTILLLLIFVSVSCKTMDRYYKTQEDLDLSIKAYNMEFESKAIDMSARFVHPKYRTEYMAKSPEIAKRITIFEASILDIKLSNDNEGVPPSSKSEKDINRAIVVIRYQTAILPSTKLKTLLIEQEWVLYQGQWVIIPDLNAFLK